MTVYGLIQGLVRYSADKEVVIKFTSKGITAECPECETDFDTRPEEMSGSNISVRMSQIERNKVFIEVNED